MRLRTTAVLALAAAAGFAASMSAGATVHKSRGGLHGTLSISPARPVCRTDEPCSRPLVGATLVFRHRATIVGRARTKDEGRYRLALPPGRYSVSVQRGAGKITTRPDRSVAPTSRRVVPGELTPSRVVVPAGRFKHVDFELDIGIR